MTQALSPLFLVVTTFSLIFHSSCAFTNPFIIFDSRFAVPLGTSSFSSQHIFKGPQHAQLSNLSSTSNDNADDILSEEVIQPSSDKNDNSIKKNTGVKKAIFDTVFVAGPLFIKLLIVLAVKTTSDVIIFPLKFLYKGLLSTKVKISKSFKKTSKQDDLEATKES